MKDAVYSAFFSFVIGMLTLKTMMTLAERVNFSVVCYILGALTLLGSVL